MSKVSQKLYRECQDVVATAIRQDVGLREAFHANIAMAFLDCARWNQARKDKRGRPISWTDMREIANEAADYFLKQWVEK